jgi:N-acetylglutamate synthase-like GNAT family acetyltransferase
MKIIPYFIISIRPEKKEPHEDFHGRISLMTQEFKEIAYLEFSKSKKGASIYINYVSVDIEYRQKELGRMMVSILESLARHLGVSRIYSNTVSDEGEILMKKCGYKKTKRNKYYHKRFGKRKTY